MRGNLAIAIVSAVIWAAPARADDHKAKARQQVGAAEIDYRLGRFAAALDEYTRAYELYPVPALLFNIGQCHKNLAHYEQAIFFFEGFLRDDPKTPDRAVVEDLIRESRAALDHEPESAGASPPVTPPSAPVAPPPPAPAPVVPPPGDHGPDRSRVVPSVLIGGGVAALVGGGVFYYYGQKRGAEQKYVYDDTRLFGGTLAVAGAAAIVTGAILWLRRPEVAGGPVATLAPDAGYLGWAGTF